MFKHVMSSVVLHFLQLCVHTCTFFRDSWSGNARKKVRETRSWVNSGSVAVADFHRVSVIILAALMRSHLMAGFLAPASHNGW